ncbi:DUF4411 family protein [Arthrobacter gyeryongensis]|uniref:DUF4411 family protein n=1 Tax=Arthrobacter gyeryongensis TaxID=1650592 RepID=A0ABP9SC09_9MICC
MRDFYSFDTSAILNGRRDLFRPTVFQGLWANIEGMIVDGRIRSVDIVREELNRRDDDASSWASNQRELFCELDEEVQMATRDILRSHPKLVGAGTGRNGADPFVIALAMVTTGTVVTEEHFSGNLQKPKIPDVCQAIGVPCVNLMGFIEGQGWTF